jgi:hypothetical protein
MPPMRDQPSPLVWQHLIFLNGAPDCRLLVGRVVSDADQLRGLPLM